MKSLFFSFLFVFAIIQVQAQCKIDNVKLESSELKVYDSQGHTLNRLYYSGDDYMAYDFSSCWVAVASWGSGWTTINLYDSNSNNAKKTISMGSNRVNSIKIIGDKIKVVYENGSEETKDIN